MLRALISAIRLRVAPNSTCPVGCMRTCARAPCTTVRLPPFFDYFRRRRRLGIQCHSDRILHIFLVRPPKLFRVRGNGLTGAGSARGLWFLYARPFPVGTSSVVCGRVIMSLPTRGARRDRSRPSMAGRPTSPSCFSLATMRNVSLPTVRAAWCLRVSP